MKDERLSKTDELATMLNIPRVDQQPADGEKTNAEDQDFFALSEARPKRSDVPEADVPTEKEQVRDTAEAEVPAGEEETHDMPEKAPYSHFSEAQEDENGNDGVSSHFTESDAEDNDGDDEDECEEDDPYAGLSRPKRILKRICNFFANLGFLGKAVIYVTLVLIVSAYLAYYVISIGNDVFALVTGSTEIKVTLPEDATEDTVADILVDKGLVDYKWVFSFYLQHYGDGETIRFIPGEHTLNTDMNYSQLLTALTSAYKPREIVTLTFPEGFTVDDIIDLFVANGIGTREGFVDAINNYPYKHEFVQLLEQQHWPESRVYRLEGYLYPDTYDFYTDTEEHLAINKLLNNFNDKVWVDWKSTYAEQCEQNGFTLDDIITLASMIEAEGKTAEDFECISYVFHNRLKNPADFPKLESDATIQYAYELAGMDREQDASQINVQFDSPYNTYLHDGLPPGAICNAGTDAILAAIYPSPPLDDNDKPIKNIYFFVSNNAGKTYYAQTAFQHERNKERVKKENEAMQNEASEG